MSVTHDNIPPNVKKLADYINSQPNPQEFALVLLTIATGLKELKEAPQT